MEKWQRHILGNEECRWRGRNERKEGVDGGGAGVSMTVREPWGMMYADNITVLKLTASAGDCRENADVVQGWFGRSGDFAETLCGLASHE